MSARATCCGLGPTGRTGHHGPHGRWARIGLMGLLCAPAGAVHAADLPHTQEGLWDVHIATTMAPAQTRTVTTFKLCRNAEAETTANNLYRNVQGCTVQTTERGSNRYAVQTRCVSRGTVILTTSTLTYRGATAKHSESKTTYTPPIQGKTQATSIADEKFVGPCPSGMKPGDRMAADGNIQSSTRTATPASAAH